MLDIADFVINQGSNWPKQITLKNDDGSLMNLADCQAHMQVRPFPQSPTVVLDLSTAAGSMTLDPTAAQLSWDVSEEDTAQLQPAASNVPPLQLDEGAVAYFIGYFDLLIKRPSGSIDPPYLSGRCFLELCNTHPF